MSDLLWDKGNKHIPFREWGLSFSHVPRGCDTVADTLANLAWVIPYGMTIFHAPPDECIEALMEIPGAGLVVCSSLALSLHQASHVLMSFKEYEESTELEHFWSLSVKDLSPSSVGCTLFSNAVLTSPSQKRMNSGHSIASKSTKEGNWK
ncbi:hypothetical protein F3Y22_tig00111151pilonHSYRG00131 [Hibiscus syriacus]|uniref:Uncharacterized protein n=1 Tax=Hibiscus syriacus TaxID=106335 RepID=A0A6A2YXK9_HIBSY|nr:hypothetical protein F3Y22_tig00111151pilonHSYRG00131 [Hibiscus syriacus]